MVNLPTFFVLGLGVIAAQMSPSAGYIFPDYLIIANATHLNTPIMQDPVAVTTTPRLPIELDSTEDARETSKICEPTGIYSKPDPEYCDRYLMCNRGNAQRGECTDGFGFAPLQGCKLLHEVDCGNRHKLQEPKGYGLCPRLNGIFADQRRLCDRFVRCADGKAVQESCSNQQVFDDRTKVCRAASAQEYIACFLPQQAPPKPTTTTIATTKPPTTTRPTVVVVPVAATTPTTVVYQGSPTQTAQAGQAIRPQSANGFVCPSSDNFNFGDHSRYPYPGNCHRFYICLHDGSIKLGGCAAPTAFNPNSQVCESMTTVPSCYARSHLSLQ